MKSCEQMADNVLRRIDECRRRQKRRRSMLAVSGSLVVIGISVWLSIPTTNHTGNGDVQVVQPSTPKTSSRLQIAYLDADGWTTAEMQTQIETEMRYSLFVTDIRDLSEEQKERLFSAEETQLETKMESIGVPTTTGKSMMLNLAWDNALFALVRGGGFRLALDESKQVKCISAACESGYGEAEMALCATGLKGEEISYLAAFDDEKETSLVKKAVGDRVWLHAKRVALEETVLKDLLKLTGGQDGEFTVCWRPSPHLYETLNKRPDTPLSDFSDTLTVAVTYDDDTLDIHEIDMVFEDDGTIKALYRGAVVVK